METIAIALRRVIRVFYNVDYCRDYFHRTRCLGEKKLRRRPVLSWLFALNYWAGFGINQETQ